MRKFNEIINRAEEIRQTIGLNKSQFSSKIGMKPQTYNNFVGVQGSKPNIELIHGIVQEFNVNPQWLLNGVGETFTNEGNLLEEVPEGADQILGEAISKAQKAVTSRSKGYSQLRKELDLVLKPSREKSTPLLNKNYYRDHQANHAIQILTHNFFITPEDTAAHVMDMLNEFSRIANEMDVILKKKSMLDKKFSKSHENN